MAILQETFQHPTQGSRVTLAVFEQPPDHSPVQGMPDDGGFLCTEEWKGSSKVVKTLGFFADRAAAEACLRRRAEALLAQRFRPIAPAA
ncbi:MAG TPA: hypothetical protein VFM29_03975 [Vicinamibacteria bacterium]|nr:hypothetical protein [Vicinamibacteria bacterium]